MKAPTCPLCTKEHWSWEPHAGIGPVHNSAKSWTYGIYRPSEYSTPPPAADVPSIPESVTPVTESVTVPKSKRNAAAERQARYRQRKGKG